MVAGLSGALAKKGSLLSVVTPLYRCVRSNYPKIKPWGDKFQLILGKKKTTGRFYTAKIGKGVNVYFVDCSKYYDRVGIYQESGNDYFDNPERYIFFSKSVLLLAKRLRRQPDILHCHDWQTGLIPLMNMQDKGLKSQTCLTIHNLAYQGVFDAKFFELTNLPQIFFKPVGIEFYGRINFLKAGIVFANKLTTVSPTYAKEILTEKFGEGLNGVVKNRKADLTGILNGADYLQWRTTKNKFLRSEFSAENLTGKYINKRLIRKELRLSSKVKGVPIYSFIGRLAHQKGIHLLLETLPHLLKKYNIHFILLGAGDPYLENQCGIIASQFPNQTRFITEYNESLAHRIKAGSDFLLMPSMYEPCGLNQMYALRYGTIPIVNSVGGLNDSIIDFKSNQFLGNGFKIAEIDKHSLLETIIRSLKLYSDRNLLNKMRKRVMKIDFSWDKSVNRYEEIYSYLKASQ